MATEELENLEIVEETPPTTPTEQEPKKKRPGPHNPDQAAKFVIQTTQSVDRFMSKMHNQEPDAIKEGYQILIAEYHLPCVVLKIILSRPTENSYWN